MFNVWCIISAWWWYYSIDVLKICTESGVKPIKNTTVTLHQHHSIAGVYLQHHKLERVFHRAIHFCNPASFLAPLIISSFPHTPSLPQREAFPLSSFSLHMLVGYIFHVVMWPIGRVKNCATNKLIIKLRLIKINNLHLPRIIQDNAKCLRAN